MVSEYGHGFTLPAATEGCWGEEAHLGLSEQQGEKDYSVTNYLEPWRSSGWLLGLELFWVSIYEQIIRRLEV